MNGIRSYALVTGAYWGFTITDGALRMLVVLHFYHLGYSGIAIAFLFLFYEFFGIVTNLLGGWIASRSGLKTTLYSGLALQIAALLMLALLQPGWAKTLSVAYVMAAQALSGIAKDLTKMSAKSAIKVVVPDDTEGTLVQVGLASDRFKECFEGCRVLCGRSAPVGTWLHRRSHRYGRWSGNCAFRNSLLPSVRDWTIQEKGKVHCALFEESGDQLAIRR